MTGGSGTKTLVVSLSVLLGIVSAFMAVCAAFGLVTGEGENAILAFGPGVILGLGALGASLSLLRVGRRPVMTPKTGYLFVTLSWVLATALGATPFVMYGAIPSYADAFFETMSGFTTTGASILTDIEALPRSLLLWRATTHWLGGMGIVVLTVAIFPLLGIGGRGIMEAESPGPQVDKFTPKLSQTAKILWLIYFGLTVIEATLLRLGGLTWFDAVTHAFATMATGGFSTRNASVAGFRSGYVDAVITIFMVLAGINFGLFWRSLRGDLKSVARDSELRAYLGILVTATAIVVWDLSRTGVYGSVKETVRYATFQTASILTTTGFVTADYLQWPSLAQVALFALMFVGGCAGSTGGGVKVVRLLTMFRMGLSEMKYLQNPRGIYGVFVSGTYLRKNMVYDMAAMIFLYFMIAFASTVVMATGGFDIMTSLTSTMACLGNIGPGFGLVGPVFNYSFLPDYLLWWLSFVMLVGRLEVYTVLILFTRAFWRT